MSAPRCSDGWEFKTWLVSEDGCAPTYYETREEAEDFALSTVGETPGYRVVIYQAVAIAESKVLKPKLRSWTRKATP